MEQIRVLLVHSGASWGGAPVAMLKVMEALSDFDRFSLSILINTDGQALNEYQKRGYECYVLPFPTLGGAGGRRLRYIDIIRFCIRFILAFPNLYRFLKRGRYDYVYLNSGINFSPALACNWIGIPVIWQIRELLDERSMLGRWYCRSISKRSKAVIATSCRVASAIGSDKHIKVIYDGISEDFLATKRPDEISAIRKQWGFNNNHFIVGLVAAITWNKGHFVLLDALRLVLRENANIRVVFVGGTVTPSNYHRTLRARVKRFLGGYSDAEELLKKKVREKELTGIVKFDGWRFGNDLIARMHAIDLLVFPAMIPEGFGLPVAEAALCGKPSVAVNIGSLPELIQDDYTGWLIPKNDCEALAKCILKAAANPEMTKKMGERARTIALGRFTASIHKRRILETFNEILSGGAERVANE